MEKKKNIISSISTKGGEINKKKVWQIFAKISKGYKGNVHFLSGHEKGSDQEAFEYAMLAGHDFTSYCPRWEKEKESKQQAMKDALFISDANTILYFWDSNIKDSRVLSCERKARDQKKKFVIIESATQKIVNVSFVAEQTLG